MDMSERLSLSTLRVKVNRVIERLLTASMNIQRFTDPPRGSEGYYLLLQRRERQSQKLKEEEWIDLWKLLSLFANSLSP